MLDEALSSLSILDAVNFFSEKRGPFGLIAKEIGFSNGVVTILGYQRPQREVSGKRGFRGWDHWFSLTQGGGTLVGPSIACQIDSRRADEFSSLKSGDFVLIEARLKEASADEFVFECW